MRLCTSRHIPKEGPARFPSPSRASLAPGWPTAAAAPVSSRLLQPRDSGGEVRACGPQPLPLCLLLRRPAGAGGSHGAARSLSSGHFLTFSAIQVSSLVPPARHTERHPGRRMKLRPRPPDSTEAACPSARAPAPTQRMSLPPRCPVRPHCASAPPSPAGALGQLRQQRGAAARGRGADSEVGGARRSGPPRGWGAGEAGGEGVRSAVTLGSARHARTAPRKRGTRLLT